MATTHVNALKWAGYGAAVGVAVALLEFLTITDENIHIGRRFGLFLGSPVFFGIIGAVAAGIQNKSRR